MESHLKDGAMITCGTPDGTKDGEKKSDQDTNLQGLPFNHAFSIMDTLTLEDALGNQVRLVQLRNPWGEEKWKGPWSDSSTFWTDALREQVKHESSNDGKFFMAIKDYMEQVEYTEFNRDVASCAHGYLVSKSASGQASASGDTPKMVPF